MVPGWDVCAPELPAAVFLSLSSSSGAAAPGGVRTGRQLDIFLMWIPGASSGPVQIQSGSTASNELLWVGP